MYPRHEYSKNEGSVKHLVYNLEKAIACMGARGDKKRFVILVDYTGFTMANSPPLKVTMDIAYIMQNHYPERLTRIYFINPPWNFSTFWAMVSPFLDQVTKEKIQFISDTDLVKVLSATIYDLDVVEAGLGGYRGLLIG
jgi:hypothetical protein